MGSLSANTEQMWTNANVKATLCSTLNQSLSEDEQAWASEDWCKFKERPLADWLYNCLISHGCCVLWSEEENRADKTNLLLFITCNRHHFYFSLSVYSVQLPIKTTNLMYITVYTCSWAMFIIRYDVSFECICCISFLNLCSVSLTKSLNNCEVKGSLYK